MATLSRHRLQMASLRWHVRPLIVRAIDDGQWSGKQIVDRQIVEARDVNHHILLASVRTPDMRVGGDSAAIAEMMRTLVLSHEVTEPSRFGNNREVRDIDPARLPHPLLPSEAAVTFYTALRKIDHGHEGDSLAVTGP